MTCEFGRPGTGLFGLFPGAGPNGSAEELGRVYPQDIRQLPDDLQAHIGHRPLDPAHEADRLRGTLVGKRLTQVHVPSHATCGLKDFFQRGALEC
jgi:hypothetical protein